MENRSISIDSLTTSPLSQLKGIDPARVRDYLAGQAELIKGSGRHALRKIILGQELMQKTNYMSLNLQIRHFHCDYSLETPLQAAFVTTCLVYHPWHIVYIA